MSGYSNKPVSRAVRPDKQGAKRHYGSHPYFTKRAWNVVQEYIKHFSRPGDVVLDPFGGSGVTAVESLVLGRRAIYVDISEWASFLARQTAIAPINLGALSEAFLKVEETCRGPIESIWKRRNEELANEPVRHWYPKSVSLPRNADVQFVEDLFSPKMLHGLAALRAAIGEVRDTMSRELLLFAFSSTLARINLTFLSTANRRASRGGSAIFSLYRYKVAKEPVELPLWDQFAQRIEKLMQAKRETNMLIGDFYRDGETAIFRQGSATRLGDFVEPESVDYIYTDPPYGGHISYLDLSTMWAAWLGFSITDEDREDEVIEGGQLRKSQDAYQVLLADSIRQMVHALRPGAWLSLVFAHRDTSYWDTIVDACEQAGLSYVNTVVQPVGVIWSMHKKKNPLRVLSGELILNFRNQARRRRIQKKDLDLDAEELVLRCCAERIVRRFGASTEDLHHAVIPMLLEAGRLAEFSRSCGNLTPVLDRAFEFDDTTNVWHLHQDLRFLNSLEPDRLAAYLAKRFLQSRAQSEGRPNEEEVASYLAELESHKNRLPHASIEAVIAHFPSLAEAARHGRRRVANALPFSV